MQTSSYDCLVLIDIHIEGLPAIEGWSFKKSQFETRFSGISGLDLRALCWGKEPKQSLVPSRNKRLKPMNCNA